MRWVAMVLLVLARTAVADTPRKVPPAPKPPEWTKTPDDKYRCSRYSFGASATGELLVWAPPGKPMIFTMAARAADRSKVTYRAEGLPAGATVDAKGKFSWNIPKDATGSSKITLIAESAGGKATYTFVLAIADPDLVLAWHTGGMGSYEPDCQHRVTAHEIVDVNGDGKTDLIYLEGDEKDDSANQGSYLHHVQLRLPNGKFDSVSRTLPNGDYSIATLPDGTHGIVVTSRCCCLGHVDVYRITAAGVDDLLDAGGQDCNGYDPFDVETDSKGRLSRVVTRYTTDAESGKVSENVYVWKDGSFTKE